MMYTHIHTNTAVIICRTEMSEYIKINVRKKFRNMKGNHWRFLHRLTDRGGQQRSLSVLVLLLNLSFKGKHINIESNKSSFNKIIFNIIFTLE